MGAARGLFEPFTGAVRESGCLSVLLSGDRSEGLLFPGVRPRILPPGRAQLIRPGEPVDHIQTAYLPAASGEGGHDGRTIAVCRSQPRLPDVIAALAAADPQLRVLHDEQRGLVVLQRQGIPLVTVEAPTFVQAAGEASRRCGVAEQLSFHPGWTRSLMTRACTSCPGNWPR